MDAPKARPSAHQKRIGLSRYIVPHPAFAWYIRGTAVSALACGALFGTWSWLFHRRIFLNLGIADRPDYPELASAYHSMTLTLSVLMAVTAAVFMGVSAMFLFHRIAGPIYNMKMHMLDVIAGRDVRPLSFREGDQFGDLELTYNQLLTSLDLIEPKPLAPLQNEGTPPPR